MAKLKEKILLLATIGCIAIAIILITACGDDSDGSTPEVKNPLVGEWQLLTWKGNLYDTVYNVEYNRFIKFLKNGEFTIITYYEEDPSTQSTGFYKIDVDSMLVSEYFYNSILDSLLFNRTLKYTIYKENENTMLMLDFHFGAMTFEGNAPVKWTYKLIED
ncbi:MAG: hypothetical protein FWG85_00545 [Bacteroidetes bacterium]|nr:hypothetical protein [Bacteroidota bacterium]